MGDDINIPLEKLESLGKSLQNIVKEFNDARSRGNELEGHIGSPHGESALRSEVDRFENAWDDKRKKLSEELTQILDRVTKVGKGWRDFDIDTAKQLEASE